MTKIVKIEEIKIHIFWESRFIFGKNATYDDVKSDIIFWNIFLGLKRAF